MNIMLAGDVWLAPSLINKKSEIDLKLNEIVQDTVLDLFICNLEAPFKTEQGRHGRRALLHTESELLDSLKIADTNILILANNHQHDFGGDGLIRTIYGCKERGFLCVGAGSTLDKARKPLIIELENRRIAIMSYADTASHVGSISATKNKPGVAPLELDIILEDISEVKKVVEDIWIFLHWGKEFIRYPMPIQRQICETLIKAGVTMLVGHHPHVLVGHEKFINTDVHYSLGNFIFPDIPLQDNCVFTWDKTSRSSMILKVSLKNTIWKIDRHYLFLNKNGLPEVDVSNKPIKEYEKISATLRNENYDKIYLFYSKYERIKRLVMRFANIKKLWKDFLWRYNGIRLR